MALETGDYVSDLDFANPPGTDPRRQGADHLRLIKKAVKQTFPNFTGVFTRAVVKSSSYSVTADDNHVIFLLSGSGSVLTLPEASTLPTGWAISVRLDGATVATLPTIIRSSTNTLVNGFSDAATSVQVRPRDLLLVRRISSTQFLITGGEATSRPIEDVLCGAPFWDFTPAGGTAEQPATVTYSRSTSRFRGSITWGTSGGEDGNPTTIVWAFSGDSGTTYNTIATQAFTYDASANVTGMSWS